MTKQKNIRVKSILVILLCSFVLWLTIAIVFNAVSLAGMTITVTTTNDELNMDEDCSLREAIQAATTDSAVSGCPAGNGADTVIVPSGIYRLTSGLYTYISVFDGTTIEGAGADTTVIDGAGIGGVFYVSGSITTTISGVTIQNGQISGKAGGGIWNTGVLMLVNSAVISNTASGGGAGIHNQDGVLTLVNTTVMSNTTSSDGGGILNDYDGIVTLINSTVSYNHADSFMGGGISNQYGGTLVLVNSTVSRNSARTAGGIVVDDDSPVTLISSTVFSNTSSFSGAGGIHVGPSGICNIRNTIIAGNTSSSGSSYDCSGELTSQGYNLIQEITSCTIIGDTTGNQIGINPNLGPLENNGGPTLTHALLAGSPAVDAGNPSGCTDHVGEQLDTDQRGFPRVADGDGNDSDICDIGAYERWVPSHWVYLPLALR